MKILLDPFDRFVAMGMIVLMVLTTTISVGLRRDVTRVLFRRLPRAALETYLRFDTPFDCAGAAKIEATGIALVESVESTDPTALVGLPLIRLTTMLTAAGIEVPPR